MNLFRFPFETGPCFDAFFVGENLQFFPQEIELKMSRLERLTEEEQQLFENIGSEEPQYVGRWAFSWMG